MKVILSGLGGSIHLTMKLQITFAAVLVCFAMLFVSGAPRTNFEPQGAFETRCGWFSNPTPANIWLYDREGEWTIGVQGGYQTPGDWPWPKFKPGQWVVTNAGDHGYGCACLQVRVNKRTNDVLEIKSARGRPLAQCRRDASLKKWSKMLS